MAGILSSLMMSGVIHVEPRPSFINHQELSDLEICTMYFLNKQTNSKHVFHKDKKQNIGSIHRVEWPLYLQICICVLSSLSLNGQTGD